MQNISNLLATLITELALTQPVAYIRNIVFFNNGTEVGDCNWDQPKGMAPIVFNQFQPAFLNLKKNFNNFTDIEVTAIDSEGNPMHTKHNLASLLKNRNY